MTTPKAKLAGLALIAALCAGSILGLTACTGEMPRTGAETPPAEVDFNAGVAAYKQGDYKTAFEKFEPLAEQGYARAQYNLGNLYRFGKCVPRNEEAAAKWYCHAAKQGQAEALYALEGMITVQQIAAKIIAGMGIQGHLHKFQKYEKGMNRIAASRLWQFSLILGRPISWFFEGIDKQKRKGDDLLAKRETLQLVRYLSACDPDVRNHLAAMIYAVAGKAK